MSESTDRFRHPAHRSRPHPASVMKEQKTPPMPMLADTPREGTPSFDDLDSAMAEDAPPVPEVGPTPDYAKEYVGPRPLAKRTDHKTTELQAVKVAPEADPRRAPTQKNLRTLQREGAGAAPVAATATTDTAAATGTADATTAGASNAATPNTTPSADTTIPDAGPPPSTPDATSTGGAVAAGAAIAAAAPAPESSPSPTVVPSGHADIEPGPESQRPSRGAMLFALFGLGAFIIALIVWVATRGPSTPSEPSAATEPTGASAPAPTPTPNPTAAATPAPGTPATAGTAASAEEPSPSATEAPEPSAAPAETAAAEPTAPELTAKPAAPKATAKPVTTSSKPITNTPPSKPTAKPNSTGPETPGLPPAKPINE